MPLIDFGRLNLPIEEKITKNSYTYVVAAKLRSTFFALTYQMHSILVNNLILPSVRNALNNSNVHEGK